MSHASSFVRALLVVGFFAVATAVCTFPQILHLADGMPPAPDTLLHSWILAWDIHALTTNPLHLYDANIYYPFPLSLTYSDAMLSGAILVAPVLLLTGNPVLAHNILTVASFFVAGVGMYLLVRELTGSDLGALVGGSIFAFCAARQAHVAHVNLVQFGWLPLALLYFHKAVQRGRTADLLLFALFTVCQALASVYLAWMMAIAYVIFIVIELATRRSTWKIGNMARVGGALLLAAAVVIPVMWPYERLQQIYAFHWPTDLIGALSAVPTDYLSVPPQNVLYADILGRFAASDFPTEHILFPGFAALGLALVAIVRRSLNIEVLRYALMSIVACGLSFGPFLRLGSQGAESIPLPYLYLLQFVPGFAVMRVPSRFDFLVMLGLGVVAGFGVARLSDGLSRRFGPLVRYSILSGVVVLALLELLPRPQPIEPVSVGADVPPVYGWLRAQDPTAVVAEIPVRGPTGFASSGYEYMSIYHWHPLVNGSSGFEPPASKSIEDQLDAFPDPTAVANLRSLGVQYLIAHLDTLDSAQLASLKAADLAQVQVSVAATFGPDVVYALAPLSHPSPVQDHVRVDLPTLVGRGVAPTITVTISNDTPQPLFIGAPEWVEARIEWDHAGTIQSPAQAVPAFVEPDDQLELQFPAALSSTLHAADSAVLTVHLSGSVQLDASQTVQIVDLPTSVDPTALAAAVDRVQLPKTVHPSTSIPVEVIARNTGRAIWLPDASGTTRTPGVVGVSVRSWTGADGKVWPPSADSTAHVQSSINPGQTAELTLHTSTPPLPGHYTLLLDMLSESVAWFNDVGGGAQTRVSVDVGPAETGSGR